MFPGSTQVPALLPRAHQCKASAAKSPARRLLAAEKDSEPHVAPQCSNKCRGPTKPGRRMKVEPPLLPAPPHISSPGQDPAAAHHSRGEQSILAAKSSANPDLFEGLRSRRTEPPGKVRAISGHCFPAL